MHSKLCKKYMNPLFRVLAYDPLFMGYYEQHIYIWFLSKYTMQCPQEFSEKMK